MEGMGKDIYRVKLSEMPRKHIKVLEDNQFFFSNFDPKKLSILKLTDYLYMLPKLDSLSKMSITLKIPDVYNLQTLEEFSFKGCSNLVSVHIINLASLERLGLFGCSSLEKFPKIPEKDEKSRIAYFNWH
ncbi:hypothetical protein Ahy_A05g023534 [Arachis hypogaea]|uniref:Uncharacterized protein n=1 Tax=Arachis hypogaea TaxID=3818 RepID=A0A445D3R3_ARAHY|nr:hypothetical protein Ahy_A05g023534 [Arachis hypogaea]